MQLFRKFVRSILIEAKVDDVAKKYPDLDRHIVDELYAADLSPTKKYFPWMVKQVASGFKSADIIPSIEFFHRNLNKFTKRDINAYKTAKELEDAVKDASEIQSKTAQKKQVKAEGAFKLHEDDDVTVVRIDTKQAAQAYGAGTRWCITMAGQTYYEQYTSSNVIFHFILKKKPLGDKFDKIAVASQRTENNRIYSTEYYDAEDHKFNARLTIEPSILSQISVDAEAQPKAFLAKLKSGDKITNEEALSYWNYLDSKAEQWAFIGQIPETQQPVLTALIPHINDQPLLDVLSGKANFEQIDYDDYDDGEETNYETIEYRNKSGQLHRLDGPAIIDANGSQVWWQNGLEHRVDGPSTMLSNGAERWVQFGQLHREDGPALDHGDRKEWWQYGKKHREDGPAEEYANGYQAWYINGKLHRLDGPAETNGRNIARYWIDGVKYKKADFFKYIKNLAKK